MAQAITEHTTPQDVYDWVQREAKKRRLKLTLHTDATKRDHNFLHVPAHLEIDDLYEKAVKLQALEDSWNNQDPYPQLVLVLIPARQRA